MTTMTENMADQYFYLIVRRVRHLAILKHILKYNSKIGKLVKYYEISDVLNVLKPPLEIPAFVAGKLFIQIIVLWVC